MNAVTTLARASATINAPFAFKGKNKMVRDAALAGVATLAYTEGKSRAETIINLRLAMGSKPTDPEVAAIRAEYVVGRTAQRLAVSDLTSPELTVAERIAFARQLVTSYAAPVKDGVKANKLRKGQLGRRSISQHKVIRAAEEAWSQVKAELGIGTAQTQGERNAKKTRAPGMAGSTARGKKGAAPTHSVLVTPEKPKTANDAVSYITTQAATLLAFCNKHGALVPTEFGLSVKRFHAAIMALDGERRIAQK